MDFLRQFYNEQIVPNFPIIVIIVFVIGALLNLGHFFGEGADWKRGITKLIIFVAVIFGIVGLIALLANIKLPTL